MSSEQGIRPFSLTHQALWHGSKWCWSLSDDLPMPCVVNIIEKRAMLSHGCANEATITNALFSLLSHVHNVSLSLFLMHTTQRFYLSLLLVSFTKAGLLTWWNNLLLAMHRQCQPRERIFLEQKLPLAGECMLHSLYIRGMSEEKSVSFLCARDPL